jgi:pimeloyl-ACP methyl ester carboxylesterase
MATADPAQLDARVRAAELTLAAHYGRTLVEHVVQIEGGYSPETMAPKLRLRIVEYPAVTRPTPAAATLPPILLLHGVASSAALLLPLLASLPDRRVLAIDWPGHGLSAADVIDSSDSLRSYLVMVISLAFDTFDVSEVDIIGHSLGGQAALYFAVAKPDKVRKLVLLGAPGAAFSPARASFGMRVASIPGVGTALLGLSTSQRARDRAVDRLLGAGALAGYPAEISEIGYLASQRSEFAPSVASVFRAMMTPFAARADVALTPRELAHLRVPTLIVWGVDDAILTPERGRASADAIPDVTILEIAGGHAPWLNDLTRVGDAVSAFLD